MPVGKKRLFVVLVMVFLLLAVHQQMPWFRESPFITNATVSRDLAFQWLTANLRENGLFVYRYNPETGEQQDVNNDVRQLLASRVLAEACAQSRQYCADHKKNLAFILQHWYQEDSEQSDIAYIYYNGRSKLGGNAMAVRTLVASPYYDQYQTETEKLAASLLALQYDDGSFEPWYVEPFGGSDKERLLYFYSGEALVALLELYKRSNDERYLIAAQAGQDFYLKEYVEKIEQNYYPAYVPWHTISLNLLYKETGEERYAEAIFILNDKLLEIQDTTDVIGRFYNPATPEYGSPHASSDAVYTEGLAYAYEIAVLIGDHERTERYQRAIELGVENLRSLQYVELAFPSYSPQEKYLGAIATSRKNPEVRVDTVQHTIDAFTKVLQVF